MFKNIWHINSKYNHGLLEQCTYGVKDDEFETTRTIKSNNSINYYHETLIALTLEYQARNLPVAQNIAWYIVSFRFNNKSFFNLQKFSKEIDKYFPELNFSTKYLDEIISYIEIYSVFS